MQKGGHCGRISALSATAARTVSLTLSFTREDLQGAFATTSMCWAAEGRAMGLATDIDMSSFAKPRLRCRVDRVPMDHPGEMTGLLRLFEEGELDPASIVAILGKTEGNGCVNDFSRPYAVDS